MKKKNELVTQLYKFSIYVIDIIIILGSIYFSFMIKFKFNPPKFNYELVLKIAPWIVFAYLVYMYVFGMSDILKQSIGEIIYSILLILLLLMITTTFIAFFARGFSYPRTVIIISFFVQFFFLSCWRSIVWKIKRKVHGVKNSLVIGNDAAEYVSKKIIIKQRELYNIKYICNSKSLNISNFMDKVDVVFLCNDVELDLKKSVVDRCLTDRKSIYIIPDIYEIALLNSKLNKVDDIPILKLKKLGLTMEQKILKRILDIVVSLIGIVISSPIMAIMAIIVKVSDGGKILFKQERVTINEKKFDVLKFRTMVMNAEKLSGPVLAGEDDLRITKVGKFMRSTRIDELPQLFNILLGDMSIVGPRPERPYFVEKFKTEIPDFKYRTIVKAGLTGLAQVWGKYSTTPEDKIRYDIIYIKSYSVLLDVKLILQTVKIMFMKESSAGVKEEKPLEELMNEASLEIVVDKEKKV